MRARKPRTRPRTPATIAAELDAEERLHLSCLATDTA